MLHINAIHHGQFLFGLASYAMKDTELCVWKHIVLVIPMAL